MRSYEMFIICIAVLLAVRTASALDILPGQTIYVDCNGTSASVPVVCGSCQNQTCPDCPDCEDCGTCTIYKEMAAGETYERNEGTCDLEFTCNLPDDRHKTERSYTVETRLEKHEGDEFWVEQEIRDMFGTVIDNKQYEMERDDIMTTTYRYNFTCPTEVIMQGINYKTCSMYLDDYINESNPLFFQLSLGQTTCMQALITCEAEVDSSKSLARGYKDQLEDCQTWRAVAEQKLGETEVELNKTQVSITGEFTQKYYGYVPGIYASLAWLFGFLFFVHVVAVHFIGGKEVG